MKKIAFVLGIICIFAITLIGCSKPELKNVRGKIASMEFKDSIVSSMILSVDGNDVKVKMNDARYQNGIALAGDSIILDYIDWRDDSLRALVVTVLPKEVKPFVPTDTLVTVSRE